MTNTIKTAVASAITAMTVASASAAQIPFSAVSFSGGVTLDTGNVLTASAITGTTTPVNPTIGTGIFSGVSPTDVVTFNPFVFSPAPASFTLWSFTDAGLGITASLWANGPSITHSHVSGSGLNTLNIFGTGTMSATGYDPTPAAWSISITQAGITLALANSNLAVPSRTPDAGATLGLMGLGLMGLASLRRR